MTNKIRFLLVIVTISAALCLGGCSASEIFLQQDDKETEAAEAETEEESGSSKYKGTVWALLLVVAVVLADREMRKKNQTAVKEQLQAAREAREEIEAQAKAEGWTVPGSTEQEAETTSEDADGTEDCPEQTQDEV